MRLLVLRVLFKFTGCPFHLSRRQKVRAPPSTIAPARSRPASYARRSVAQRGGRRRGAGAGARGAPGGNPHVSRFFCCCFFCLWVFLRRHLQAAPSAHLERSQRWHGALRSTGVLRRGWSGAVAQSGVNAGNLKQIFPREQVRPRAFRRLARAGAASRRGGGRSAAEFGEGGGGEAPVRACPGRGGPSRSGRRAGRAENCRQNCSHCDAAAPFKLAASKAVFEI